MIKLWHEEGAGTRNSSTQKCIRPPLYYISIFQYKQWKLMTLITRSRRVTLPCFRILYNLYYFFSSSEESRMQNHSTDWYTNHCANIIAAIMLFVRRGESNETRSRLAHPRMGVFPLLTCELSRSAGMPLLTGRKIDLRSRIKIHYFITIYFLNAPVHKIRLKPKAGCKRRDARGHYRFT